MCALTEIRLICLVFGDLVFACLWLPNDRLLSGFWKIVWIFFQNCTLFILCLSILLQLIGSITHIDFVLISYLPPPPTFHFFLFVFDIIIICCCVCGCSFCPLSLSYSHISFRSSFKLHILNHISITANIPIIILVLVKRAKETQHKQTNKKQTIYYLRSRYNK